LETTERLDAVLQRVAAAESSAEREAGSTHLIAVSKTFDAEHIRPALDAGHRIFGENRVQESQEKWPGLKADYDDVELHLIGPLQSNKAADAVALFDAIHTIDRDKIARAISVEMQKQNRSLKLFVQVNTGEETQKSGVSPHNVAQFVDHCRQEHGLEITGLMCIPPFDENPGPHFALLRQLARQVDVAHVSMGMSGDYETAIEFGATYIRVGSAIFGTRD